jgi:4-hydroxysphinganine ceramide fatty acyl 2-hydroxylase
MVDWNKPMLAQVGKLGPNYLKWVHSPVDRPLRLFYSDFMEFFSRTPWFFVPIIWLPVVVYGSVLAIKHLNKEFIGPYGSQSFPAVLSVFLSLFILGCVLWSLVEYALHRFLFHRLPPANSPFWITFHFFLHGQHHKVHILRSFI